MVGNRVKLKLVGGDECEGILKVLDQAGITFWRTDVMPDMQGNVFLPMHRIREVVDLGRA